MDSKNITGFVDEVHVRCEREKEVKDDFKV